MFERDVEDGRAVRERSGGNIVHAQRDVLLHVFARDVARDLRFGAPLRKADGLLERRALHIVEHDDVRARVERLFELFDGLHFDLDLADEGRVGARAFDGVFTPPAAPM